MKVGSLVECIKPLPSGKCEPGCSPPTWRPKVGERYIVEAIVEGYGLTFLSFDNEFGWRVEFFREIEFPPSFEAELNELLTIKEPELV